MPSAFLVSEVFFDGEGPAKWIANAAILAMTLLVARWPQMVKAAGSAHAIARPTKRPSCLNPRVAALIRAECSSCGQT